MKANARIGAATFSRALPLVLAAALLPGCASETVAPPEAAAEIDRILREPAEAPPVETCLGVLEYRDVEILDNRHLLFTGTGERRWLNRLRHACPGLHRNDTLLFDLHATQVCNLDSVTAVSRVLWMWQRESASCTLGTFQPITEQQADLIREAARRR